MFDRCAVGHLPFSKKMYLPLVGNGSPTMRSMYPPLVGSSRQTIVQLKVFYDVKNLSGLIYIKTEK